MLYFRPFAVPRHPLLRLAMAVVGVAVLGLVVMFGLVIGAVLLGIGLTMWLIRQFTGASVRMPPPMQPSGPSAAPAPGVIEGEYVVLSKRDHD